jgi:hypothetical protein
MTTKKRKPRTYILTVRLSVFERNLLLMRRLRGEPVSETLRRIIFEAATR